MVLKKGFGERQARIKQRSVSTESLATALTHHPLTPTKTVTGAGLKFSLWAIQAEYGSLMFRKAHLFLAPTE
jgi:hypothetical protein